MQRRIVEPADVSGAALAELKSWLGITRPNEDALLINLLQSSLAMCESFTGQSPLQHLVEERVSVQATRCTLISRPVSTITKIELEAQDGGRADIAQTELTTEKHPDGSLTVEILKSLEGQAVVVTLRAGISTTWEAIPAPLKQGLIRLCAYQYHDRDRPGGDARMTAPPATISALWRPWQMLRLS